MSDAHDHIYWYNFDCGKGKIKPYLGGAKRCIKPANFELVKNSQIGLHDVPKTFIRLNWSDSCGHLFKIGDRIRIKSGLIYHQTHWTLDTYDYVYTAFQAVKIDDEAYSRIKQNNQKNDELWASTYYNDEIDFQIDGDYYEYPEDKSFTMND